ncbi:MAG: hypothetical protein RLZZ511_556 [Cyanobacteriota bacterium]|jgi:Type IV pilin-like G and H, putative/Interferon-induced transmembrane protein
MTTTSQNSATPNDALTQAKLGNPSAIEALLRQALKPHGQTAKVIRDDASLRILVEGQVAPEEAIIAPLIENGLRQLGLAEITPNIQIYGQLLGQSLPVWTKAIDLNAGTMPHLFSFDTVTVDLPEKKPVASPTPATPRSTMRPIVEPVRERPPNYLAPSIAVIFLTCFPLSLVPLIFATQVNGKFDKGDYYEAETASNRAKIWCWVNVAVAAPAYLLIGSLVLVGAASFGKAVNEVKVAERLNLVSRAQQAYALEHSQFSPVTNLAVLGVRIPPRLAELDQDYRFESKLIDPMTVQMNAIPKRAKMKSITMALFITRDASGQSELKEILCKTDKPSMQPVKTPILEEGILTCAPGSQMMQLPSAAEGSNGRGDDEGMPPPMMQDNPGG